MNHTIKALGLALLATLALGAVAAQGAGATEHTFRTGEAPATITAEGDPRVPTQTLVVWSASINCTGFHATGTTGWKEEDQLTLIPQYAGCYASGFPTTARNEGNTGSDETGACAYVFDSDTTYNLITVPEQAASLTIECEKEGSITFEIFFDEGHSEELCTLHIGEQGPLYAVNYANTETEGPEEITAESRLHDIHYTWDGPWCFLLFGTNKGTDTDAFFEGRTTFRAFNGTKSQVAATVLTP